MKMLICVFVFTLNIFGSLCNGAPQTTVISQSGMSEENDKVKDRYSVKVDNETSKITINAEIQMPPSLLNFLMNQNASRQEVNGTVVKTSGSFGGITMTIPIGRNVNVSIMKRNQFQQMANKNNKFQSRRTKPYPLGRNVEDVEDDVEDDKVAIKDLDSMVNDDNEIEDQQLKDKNPEDEPDNENDDENDNNDDDDDDDDDNDDDDNDEDEEEDDEDDDDDDLDFNGVSEYQNRRRIAYRQRFL